MAVEANRTGRNLVVTVTLDVRDIVASIGNNPVELKTQCLRRAAEAVSEAANNHSRTDADIDAEVTRAAAEAARKKAAKPTGTL